MTTIEQIVEVISASGVIPNMSKFDPTQTFKANGVDSLDVFTIFLSVEEAFGMKFSEDELTRINSAASMLEKLNA